MILYEKNILWCSNCFDWCNLFHSSYGNVYSGDVAPGLWGLIRGYGAVLPLILSLAVVAVGIAVCIWGMLEKKK